MNTLTKTIAAVTLLGAIAAAATAPASAAVDLQISEAVRAAAGYGSNVRVDVDGDTVTLSGFVEDAAAVSAIEQAAQARGAETVINNVFPMN